MACAACLVWPAEAPPASAHTLAACAKPDEATIAGQRDRWGAALAFGDADALAALYAEDAVLRVAGAPQPIIGRAAIRAHFAGFVAQRPQSSHSRRTVSVACTTASDTGRYAFRLAGRRKGTRTVLTGHYSTFYELRDGAWRIVRQHG